MTDKISSRDVPSPSDTVKVPNTYPAPGDADEDWWSVEEGCLHGAPWDEDCAECELEEDDDGY